MISVVSRKECISGLSLRHLGGVSDQLWGGILQRRVPTQWLASPGSQSWYITEQTQSQASE